MAEILRPDICVIGAGSAGLSVAAGASQMGAETVLIERALMGGDCLNYGCVPSKSLLAAAKAAAFHRSTAAMGVTYDPPRVEFPAVRRHVEGVIAGIAPTDSEARYEGLGVTVLRTEAKFVGPGEVTAGGRRIQARRFVVATGSRPVVPSLPGLDEVDHLTNETVFGLDAAPAHLIVVGGGPIGCELSQAFARLGSRVTVVELASILPNDDPELAELVRLGLRAEGVRLMERTQAAAVRRDGAGLVLEVERDGERESLAGDALLLAVGRRPVVEGLDLDAAGIAHDRKGIKVDRRLRSSNRKVFAAGDVAGGFQFTHVAGYHAGVVLKNALFRWPAKVDDRAVPWVTYTDPELAHVGLGEAAARERHGDIRILRWPFAENDRARCERRTDGLVKVVTTPRGRVLGASIVGAHAGELIQPWVLALSQKLGVGAVAQMIAPYPTLGEASKRAAGSFYTAKLFSERTRWLVRLLAKLG
ncbi:MAG: FAD-dependent oxidoreductase [Kiloniellales bacterium]|nr:FAD-dependent oxidoreductase [Kiloniellales bacterium]